MYSYIISSLSISASSVNGLDGLYDYHWRSKWPSCFIMYRKLGTHKILANRLHNITKESRASKIVAKES